MAKSLDSFIKSVVKGNPRTVHPATCDLVRTWEDTGDEEVDTLTVAGAHYAASFVAAHPLPLVVCRAANHRKDPPELTTLCGTDARGANFTYTVRRSWLFGHESKDEGGAAELLGCPFIPVQHD